MERIVMGRHEDELGEVDRDVNVIRIYVFKSSYLNGSVDILGDKELIKRV